ncbi:MAG: hypothetical protein AAF692_05715, partial [Pseudomonadota bacterium]
GAAGAVVGFGNSTFTLVNRTADQISEDNFRFDVPGDTTTTASMLPDDCFHGRIDYSGDEDWVAIPLVAGIFYQFEARATHSPVGTYEEWSFDLFNSSGRWVDGENRDGNPGVMNGASEEQYNDGVFFHMAEETGVHYVGLAGLNGWTGTFAIDVYAWG